ncbi:Pyridoxal kinase [Lachnospiraceae bacterium TWA4]|nr:Pyridoxal kinase [Lachnospiraceae bacterium TWA4]
MLSHNNQKKIALINDFTGFGRCSIAVQLPIISYLGVQCCPLPTSIFSNHTGFESFYFDDYTNRMDAYMDEWKKLDLRFEGISSGFLGSMEQIQFVEKFIEQFQTHRTQVIIDPVMGDNGKAYTTYTKDMCQEMKKLVHYADILTPNLTECCILTDTPYRDEKWHNNDLFHMADKLSKSGAKKIVITGIPMGGYIANIIYEKGLEPKVLKRRRVGKERSGTGDIFAAVISADAVNDVPFEASVKRAATFIKQCIEVTENRDIPSTDGVCFEDVLYKLPRS